MSRADHIRELVRGWLPRPPGRSGLANVLDNTLALIVASILLTSIVTSGVWNHNLVKVSSSAQEAASLLNDRIELSYSTIEDQGMRIQELLNYSMELEGSIAALESELSERLLEKERLEGRLEESLEANSVLSFRVAELEEVAQEKAEEIERWEGRTLLGSSLWEEVHGAYIATAEGGTHEKIRVWVNSGGEYVSVWSSEGVFHDDLEIGDVDNDGVTKEIVASRRTRVKGTGPYKDLYEVVLDVYKEGTSGVWMESESVVERSGFVNEIEIADVDGEPGNEVVLRTGEWLVVHKYSEDEDAFKITSSRNTFLDGEKFDLKSLAVGDIDHDGKNEILVGADLDGMESNEGYLFIFEDSSLADFWAMSFTRMPCHEGLRLGNLDEDPYLEICCVFYEVLYTDIDQAYLVILDHDGASWDAVIQEPIGEPHFHPCVKLAVGQLIPENEGEEMVMSISRSRAHPDDITIYSLEEDAGNYNLKKLAHKVLDYSTMIGHIEIGDVDADGDVEIITSGAGRTDAKSGDFYLEVFDASLSSEWRRLGGHKTEGEVWDASVG